VQHAKYVSKYTVSQNNDTDVAHYNFNPHHPILLIMEKMLLMENAIERDLIS